MAKVELFLRHWDGDHAVAASEATAMLINVSVDDVPFTELGRAMILIENGDFVEVLLLDPPDKIRERYPDLAAFSVKHRKGSMRLPISSLSVRDEDDG